MDNPHPIIQNEYKFEEVDRFQDMITSRKCLYYASDFLKVSEDDFATVETTVLHTLEVFKTLDIPTDEHFFEIFRATSTRTLYKDWKVSELACAYMLLHGDPTDTKTIAVQQTALIDQMLQHLHTSFKAS